MPSPIIVTGCDETYAALALDLVRSIRDKPEISASKIGLLDLGLTSSQLQVFADYDVEVRAVGWDLDFPGVAAWDKQMPGYKAMISRSFLRDHFPGHSAYLWMDADTWVQCPDAIQDMLQNVERSSLLIASEFDRQFAQYRKGPAIWQVFHNWYAEAFNKELADKMTLRPMLNCGVFALTATAPHWEVWREVHKIGLAKNNDVSAATFMLEQLALNIAIYLQDLPFTILPSGYNWLCHHAIPVWDDERKLFLEPSIPNRKISILHLSQKDKIGLQSIPLYVDPQNQEKMTLRYQNQVG